MDNKSCHSSGEEESSAINPNNLDSSTTNTTGTGGGVKDQYLKQLHKLSHKISKPPIRKQQPPFDFDHQLHHHPPPPVAGILDESQPSNLHNQQQHQPPVYNVSKSDFRDVVQKLTGSPAHERAAAAIPVPPVKPQSSRLQRIRPPPLEHVGNRPPNTVGGVIPSNPNFRPGQHFFAAGQRPLSPLPPLPSVHATAESPISAYMRCFQTSNPAGLPAPTSSSLTPPDFPAPSSPLPFGCVPSPKSQFPMLSPGFPFSPASQFGFQQLTPLSPTPPAPSPRWKSL